MNQPAHDDAVWCVWCVIVNIVNSQWFFQTKLNLVWNFQDIDNGHQNFPNQSEFGLESASCKIIFFLSKPNWNWFGKLYAIFGCNFSKPNWIWFGKGHWMKSSCSSTEPPESELRVAIGSPKKVLKPIGCTVFKPCVNIVLLQIPYYSLKLPATSQIISETNVFCWVSSACNNYRENPVTTWFSK